MAGLEHSKIPKLKQELLGAYRPFPYVNISSNSEGSYLVYNKSSKRLSERQITGFCRSNLILNSAAAAHRINKLPVPHSVDKEIRILRHNLFGRDSSIFSKDC